MTASELRSLRTGIRPAAGADPGLVRERLRGLTKPPESLGRLEDVALRLALVHGDPPPRLDGGTIFVLAGDHGVATRGVSAYPPEVTAQMCRNVSEGGAAINAIAGAVGARVVLADFGVDGEVAGIDGVLDRKIRRGAADFAEGAAITDAEVERAVVEGARLVTEEAEEASIVGLGEMGIGNTTSAAALAAVLTGRLPRDVVGPGTGVSEARLDAKVAVVERALARLGGREGPLELMAEVGGLEIAGLTGVCLGAARMRRPVVTDGFIATAAALAAVRLQPAVGTYLFASHLSPEPGHRVLLDALGLEPLLDLRMRLGEGTGAALAFPLLASAAAVLREMASFEEAGVSREREHDAAARRAGPRPGGGTKV